MSFWKTKKLSEMSVREWESLCDGCGKCCLNKLEDEDTGDLCWTSVACDLIDLNTCRCSRYAERTKLVPECLDLKQHDFAEFNWLPATCAYRLLTDGKDLPDWHPLVSGTADSVGDAGVSIASYALKESDVDDLEDHIIEWL
ncbi:MAG: YcgN family cysteine cluster protein [Gammaproteobacteria bacterium HGW-Gammaproteobacteria-3]|jgi:hypothetical protein|nr:MAG: YcgN family cysteine cluster protein [Gammaproteobacteria bacterium HGW-Gammaproteobacteria-3]